MGYSFTEIKKQRDKALENQDWAEAARLHEVVSDRLILMYKREDAINVTIAAAECYVKAGNFEMAKKALIWALSQCNILPRLKPMVREKMAWLEGIYNESLSEPDSIYEAMEK